MVEWRSSYKRSSWGPWTHCYKIERIAQPFGFENVAQYLRSGIFLGFEKSILFFLIFAHHLNMFRWSIFFLACISVQHEASIRGQEQRLECVATSKSSVRPLICWNDSQRDAVISALRRESGINWNRAFWVPTSFSSRSSHTFAL